MYNRYAFAGVMELVDVTDSKSVGGDIVWVRVPPPAPRRSKVRFAPTSFYAHGKKDRRPPAPLLLLSKSQPLALGCDLVLVQA